MQLTFAHISAVLVVAFVLALGVGFHVGFQAFVRETRIGTVLARAMELRLHLGMGHFVQLK